MTASTLRRDFGARGANPPRPEDFYCRLSVATVNTRRTVNAVNTRAIKKTFIERARTFAVAVFTSVVGFMDSRQAE